MLPRARWLPPPRDKPATKRPAAAGPAAGAKPKKQKQKAEYERTMPQDMAFKNIHVRGNPGNDELDELELRNTVTDASWLKEALEVQQQPLRTMIRKGLPEWLVVTSDGLLCRSCILATMHGLRVGNYNVDENTAWVGRYCRRADVSVALKQHEHGQKGGMSDDTAHKQLEAGMARILGGSAAFEAAEMSAIDKEEAAIKVRLRVLLHVVENNYPLSKYRTELEFLYANNGLADCPERGKKGSIECPYASYTSDMFRSEALESLADALHTLVHRKAVEPSPTIGFALDETVDKSRASQLAVMYRVLLEGRARMVYAGMTDLPRGTAEFTLAGLMMFMDRDEIEWSNVGSGCCDTCNVMFGAKSGLFARIQELAPHVHGQKCGNHTAALAVKHGLQELPLLRNAVDALKSMGAMDAQSSKRYTMYDEVIERAQAIDPSFESTFHGLQEKIAATRWTSIGTAADALMKSAKDYAISVATQTRHGAGDGEDGLFVIDAGSANATAGGLAWQVKREEFLALVMFLHKAMRPINVLVKKLQQQHIGYDDYTHAFNACVEELEKLSTEAAATAEGKPAPDDKYNLSSWRAFADNVKAILASWNQKGAELTRDRRRPAHAIDALLMQAKESLLGAMREFEPESKLLEDLRTLFDGSSPAFNAPVLTNALLDRHYAGALMGICNHYDPGSYPEEPEVGGQQVLFSPADEDCEDEAVLFRRADIEGEFEQFRHRYIALYEKYAPQVLATDNAEKLEAHTARMKRTAKAKRTPFIARAAPSVEMVLEAILTSADGADLFSGCYHMHMLAGFYQTAMVSQAIVESFFSHLKLVVTARRTTMTEETKGQVMYVLMNGPKGRCGQHLGIPEKDVIDLAYRIWKDSAVKYRLAGKSFSMEYRSEHRLDYRRGNWGARPMAVQEAEEAEVLSKLEAARKRREAVHAHMSARAVEEAEAAARVTFETIIAEGDETQLAVVDSETMNDPEPDGSASELQELKWIKCLEPLPSTPEELAVEAAIAAGDTVDDISGCRAAEKVGLVYRNVIEQLSDHPGGVTVGDQVAVTGFGGCVWYSGTVTAQSTRTAARKQSKSKKKQEPNFTVFFPADCKTAQMKLPEQKYGAATVSTDSLGNKKADMGWFILGSAVPMCVPERFGGTIIDG